MSQWFKHERGSALYRAQSVRRLDQQAIEGAQIPGLELMRRAGGATWRFLRQRWPEARAITVYCGPGNNGGDGFVVARLAAAGGMKVQTCLLGEAHQLKGDAARCYQDFSAAGLELTDCSDTGLSDGDGVVDALYGTGLSRPVEGEGAELIKAMNRHPGFRLCVDIPSGLHADNGKIQGHAVAADVTVTFIGMKQGLLTGDGRQLCGELVFEDLAVPADIFKQVNADAWRIAMSDLEGLLGARDRGAHKGRYGHVLVVGGDSGYAGAPVLCARAALRTGAGLVTVASRPEHLALTNGISQELMFRGIREAGDLQTLLSVASVVAIGPGLGQSDWSAGLLESVLAGPVERLVLDADALNLLAGSPDLLAAFKARGADVVCTPHPGEAARLLATDVRTVESDRFAACQDLQQQLDAVVVLKGAGSLIKAPGEPPLLCAAGNPGMASGGMGDILSGVIAALMAQGLNPEQAAAAGCVVHATAADEAAVSGGGERGLLATDLLAPIRRQVNRL